jgi:hypothetical protein
MMPLPRISALFLGVALTAAAACVGAELPLHGLTPKAVIERFKIAKDGTLVLLPVELKGKQYLFALDTGAVSCIYDSSLIPLLGAPIRTEEVETSDGGTRIQFFQPPDAKLGRSSLWTGFPVVAHDLRRLREGSGEEVYGFIGMDFLAKHVVRIDTDRSEVVFLRSAGPDAGRPLPMTFESNIPYVQVHISGLDEPQLFMVDTGCSPGGGTGLMRGNLFDSLAVQGKIKPIGGTLAPPARSSSAGRQPTWHGTFK